MKLLFVSATTREVAKFLALTKPVARDVYEGRVGQYEIRLLITGVGPYNTVFSLATELRESVDLAINVGVAGSYNRELSVGEVVHVHEEILGDLGATDSDGHFLDLSTLGFPLFHTAQQEFGNRLKNPYRARFLNEFRLHSVRGLTVNTASGEAAQIELRKSSFKPDVETMEGGAFAYACLRQNVPYVEFRCISNYVEPRNRTSWKMDLACDNLHAFLLRLCETAI